MVKIESSMFREYDVRGIADGSQLNEQVVNLLGKAYGTFLVRHNINKSVVGHDARKTSPIFKESLISGLLSSGIDVYDLGLVTTPMMYWSQYYLDCDGGVMITASHNGPEWNGFKFAKGKSYTLIGQEIIDIKNIAESEQFVMGNGKRTEVDILDAYKKDLLGRVNLSNRKRDLKIVVDCTNGAGGKSIPEIYEATGFQVIRQYCETNGDFPYESPDPSMLDFMESLGKRVRDEGADLGFGFDGDGDRLGMVDEKGAIIWPDRYMILLSRSVLKARPGAKIIFDVKCTDALEEDILAHGGKPIMWKTGHSHIKAKMRQEGAPLAGEMSGHIFFGGDDYYSFDDSTFAGLKLLEFISNDGRPVSEIIGETPYYVSTPTMHARCADNVKYQVVEKLVNDFKALEGKGEVIEVNTVNGARVRMNGGWGLVRASSNLPVLVLRMEAKSEKRLQEIKDFFRQMFKKYPEIGEKWENE